MTSQYDTLRRELTRLLAGHRERRFPPDEADDERLGELHAELADYDGYIVGVASSAADHVDVDPHRLEPNPDLRHALELFASSANESERLMAQGHLDYLDSVEAIAASARVLAEAPRKER